MLQIAAVLWALVCVLPQQVSAGFLHTFKKASLTTDQAPCDSCATADLQDPNEFDQCNFWGDPHYTETWGGLGRFDYQGLGVHDVVINNVTCDTFRMQAFHCQYRTSRNAVVLGFVIELGGSVTGTVFVNDTFVEVSAGLESLVSPIGEISTQQLQNGGINVQTGDRCNFVNINEKPINFKPGYLLNAKVRSRVGVTQNAGVCGSPQLFPTFVSDNSSFLFTSEQIEQLCEQCSSFGGEISPACPGYTPPQPPDITNDLTEECLWAADPIETQNAGTGPDITQFCATDTTIAADFGNPGPDQCLFTVTDGNGNSCTDICGLLGTTCSNVPGRVDSQNDNCEPGGNEGTASCDTQNNFNTYTCACDIPDIPFPGDNINDAEEVANNDPNISFQDAIDNCTVGCLANVTFDINVPPTTELEYLLQGCIIDWVYASNDERAAIVDNTQAQCPGLPLTETCADFTCSSGLVPDPAKQADVCGPPGTCTDALCCMTSRFRRYRRQRIRRRRRRSRFGRYYKYAYNESLMQSLAPDEEEHEEDGNFQQVYSCKGEDCEEAKAKLSTRRGSSSAQVKEVLADEL
ncbi:SLC38A6 [Symbiodinium necroappetens]|uniref:SLC38A6 protein n=1 Tax=Symbiodinium necroappetens TaxID=1628268 RepID=A0A812ZW75_9DINO|nr:SLC38A6 [Symbiodinium necroappetens]